MQLVGSVLLGADEEVAAWVAQRVPEFEPQKYVALGVVRGDRFVGGAVFHNFRKHDIEVVVAFDDPRWALPGTLRALFAYPFVTLGCVRLTALIARKNKRSRRLTEGLGFRLEGVARRAFDGRQDAMIYGMLRDECKFLRERDGQQRQQHPGARAA